MRAIKEGHIYYLVHKSVNEHVAANYPLLSGAVVKVRELHPGLDSMLSQHAFKLIADSIGFSFDENEEIYETLDRAEEFLQSKKQ